MDNKNDKSVFRSTMLLPKPKTLNISHLSFCLLLLGTSHSIKVYLVFLLFRDPERSPNHHNVFFNSILYAKDKGMNHIT